MVWKSVSLRRDSRDVTASTPTDVNTWAASAHGIDQRRREKRWSEEEKREGGSHGKKVKNHHLQALCDRA
jgi:hypothetical protein